MAGYFNPYSQLLDQADAGPLAGATAGFMQGGPIGGAVGLIGGLGARHAAYKSLDETLRNTQMPNAVGVDVYGRPTFNSAEAIQTGNQIQDLQRTARRGRRGLRKIFKSHDRSVAEHQMEMKAGQLDQALQNERDKYNQGMANYNAQQTAMQQYNQLMNNQNRLNNLYGIGTSLY